MATLVQCPGCSRSFSVAESMLGRQGRCTQCGMRFPLLSTLSHANEEATPAPTSGKLPATIDRYTVRSRLGEGAFGIVYRAHHPMLDREVAIKVLRSLTDKVVQRFLQEARILAKLDHANIVRVYDAGKTGQNYFIVSAFIAGRTLGSLIPEGGMPPNQAVTLILQLLEALHYAHTFPAGCIIHRDVKPANAMVDPKGQLFLMDFGLAGWVDQDRSRMTQDGAVMGTPGYMPPEQAEGKLDQIGPASDLYSAGVVLYEALTGRLPFEAPWPVVLYHILHTPPTPLSEYRKDIDSTLETICLRALAKRPEDRFANAREFADALQTWLATQTHQRLAPVTGPDLVIPITQVPAPARPTARVPNPPGAQAKPVSPPATTAAPSKTRWMIALGLLGLISLAVVLYLAWGGKTTSPDATNKGNGGFFRSRDAQDN